MAHVGREQQSVHRIAVRGGCVVYKGWRTQDIQHLRLLSNIFVVRLAYHVCSKVAVITWSVSQLGWCVSRNSNSRG